MPEIIPAMCPDCGGAGCHKCGGDGQREVTIPDGEIWEIVCSKCGTVSGGRFVNLADGLEPPKNLVADPNDPQDDLNYACCPVCSYKIRDGKAVKDYYMFYRPPLTGP